jgi:hypothetical protein
MNYGSENKCSESGSVLGIQIRIRNPDPDPGKLKLAPKRNKLRNFERKQIPIINFLQIIIFFLDPDRIRFQLQAGSGSVFSKIPGSGSGFSEYGSETLR